MNPFRKVFLGTGQLPADLRASLTAEGIVLLEGGLHGSVTYRNYRRPGFRAALDKKGSGTVEIRLRTPQAEQVTALLNAAS